MVKMRRIKKKRLRNGKNLAPLLKWLKMVKFWHAPIKGGKWQKYGTLLKMTENGKDVAHS